MSGYSVDLRKRIVSAVEEGGMSKAQAARTFSVGLSSVKRYVEKARRGESLVPKVLPPQAVVSRAGIGLTSAAAVISEDLANPSRPRVRTKSHAARTAMGAIRASSEIT